MGISLPDDRLALTLDEAVARARSAAPVPELWARRVERLGALGIRTYVAALGAALLAKATDDRVDSLAQDLGAGPRGYSLRKVAEFLAVHNDSRFHMGVTGRWPLNNSPFLRGPARIDDFTKISKRAYPSYELFRDCLTDLNRMTKEDAADALAAWVRVRMAAQVAQREDQHRSHLRSLRLDEALDPAAVVDMVDRFVRQDAEGGKRGQALVAAVLDGAFDCDDVSLQSINDPRPGDVQVHRCGEPVCLVEVKQVAVDESAARTLAAEASARQVSLGLLVVIADRHQPLDRERLRRAALAEHQVLLAVAESVGELVAAVAVLSATPVRTVVGELPGRYARRMRQHGVSEHGQRRWAELVEAQRYATAAGAQGATSTVESPGSPPLDGFDAADRWHQPRLLSELPVAGAGRQDRDQPVSPPWRGANMANAKP